MIVNLYLQWLPTGRHWLRGGVITSNVLLMMGGIVEAGKSASCIVGLREAVFLHQPAQLYLAM